MVVAYRRLTFPHSFRCALPRGAGGLRLCPQVTTGMLSFHTARELLRVGGRSRTIGANQTIRMPMAALRAVCDVPRDAPVIPAKPYPIAVCATLGYCAISYCCTRRPFC